MWILLIVFMAIPHHNTVLGRFAMAQDCQDVRNWVGFNMAEAYPWDVTFRVECRYQAMSNRLTMASH